jgi:flagellin-specific chaperone FliS
LIDSPNEPDYQKVYMKAVYNIGDFRKRMTPREKISDIEVSLTVLYGFMLMRMKNQSIEEDTLKAIDSIKEMIALLAKKFRDFEEGRLEL